MQQSLLLGFLLGIITWILKYRIKNEFLVLTKAKIILFYIFLVLSTLLPSIFLSNALCCDCFGPACTTITGFPFPVTIRGEVMNVYPKVMSRILLIGIIGFVLNVALYYLISALVMFLFKLAWKNILPNK